MQALFDERNLSLKEIFVENPQPFGRPPHAPTPRVGPIHHPRLRRLSHLRLHHSAVPAQPGNLNLPKGPAP